MTIWEIIHILEIILWFVIAGSVVYVVFFAIISLFYEKEDRIAIHAAALSNRMTKFLILYPAYKEDSVIINAVEQFLLQDYPKDLYTVIVISDHMQPETNEKLKKLYEYAKQKLEPIATFNGDPQNRLWNIMSATIKEDIDGDMLLGLLHERNQYVSAGSACNAHNPEPSHVLKTIGLSFALESA